MFSGGLLSGTVRLITGLNMDIVLSNKTDPYYYGDHIRGKVVIDNKSPALQCISVSIRVCANVVLRVDNLTETLSDTIFNKTFPAIKAGETVLWTQDDNPNPQKQIFPSGVTELPFSLETGNFANSPPSHESGKGAVRWYVEALFHRPLNLDVVAKQSFNIMSGTPLDDPVLSHPVKKSYQLPLTGIFRVKQRGSLELSLQVDRQGFHPGETAHVVGSFINQCDDSVTVNSICINIVQNTQCVENRIRFGTATSVLLDQKCLPKPVTTQKGDQTPINADIIIPFGSPSFQHPNITVTYTIDLIAQTSKGKLDVSCPLVLGCARRPEQSDAAPAQEPVAAAMVQPVAQGADPVQLPPLLEESSPDPQ